MMIGKVIRPGRMLLSILPELSAIVYKGIVIRSAEKILETINWQAIQNFMKI